MLKFIFTFIFLLTNFNLLYSQNDWELIKNENGIAIYLKSSDDSDFIELKTITILNTNIDNLLTKIKNVPGYTTWIYGAIESYTISSISDNEFIYYMKSDMPWPVLDRESVIKLRLDISSTKVYSQSTCVKGYVDENENAVRIYDMNGSWTFEVIDNNNVEIVYYVKLNPGNDVPNWLIKAAADIAPYKTLLALKEQVKNQE